jgi:Gpi18-like mannosyltransferase
MGLSRREWIISVFGLLVVLAIRVYAFPMVADDFTYYFNGWITAVRERGMAAWNPESFANYSPTNFYAIWASMQIGDLLGFPGSNLAILKVTTLGGDLLLGLSSAVLVSTLGRPRFSAVLAALTVWLSPTLFLNSAWWGQFDAWYAAFLILSVAALIRNRVVLSVFFFAVSFTWKAQGLFILPALGPFWILATGFEPRKCARTVLLSAGAIFLAYGMAAFPAWTEGLRWSGILEIYAGQKDAYHALSMNAPNVYSLFPGADYDRWVPIGIAIGLSFSLAIAALIFAAIFTGVRKTWSAVEKLEWLLLSAIFIPLVLPKMHERYFFIAETLASVLLVVRRDLRAAGVWLILQAVALRTYGGYLFGWPSPPFAVLVPALLVGIFLVARGLRLRITPRSV